MCTIMCSFPINYCCSRPRHGPVQPRQQRQPTAHLAHRWPFEARNPIIRLLRVLVQLLNRLYDLRCQISLCPITGIKHIIWAHVCTVQCCCHAASRDPVLIALCPQQHVIRSMPRVILYIFKKSEVLHAGIRTRVAACRSFCQMSIKTTNNASMCVRLHESSNSLSN